MTKKTIMVVDDDENILNVVENILKSNGYSVIKVQTGNDCLKLLNNKIPDLILLDIMMPVMDGWDVCTKIKANKKTEKIPIVFLTAKNDPISRSMGNLASNDYIEKPFEVNNLLSRIKKVIEKNQVKSEK